MGHRVVTFVLLAMLGGIACAQVSPNSKLTTYPPLARQARIQGTVRLVLFPSGDITTVSGHPLLTGAAMDNLKGWGTTVTTEVEYVFSFVDHTHIRTVRQLRGDAFDRFFLKIFRRKLYEEWQECVSSPNPPDIESPKPVEISPTKYVVKVQAELACIQTMSSTLAAFR